MSALKCNEKLFGKISLKLLRLFQFELKEIKRRQDAAEEAERKRIQQEQEERAAAEAAAAAKDTHDAPGSPSREPGIFLLHFSMLSINIHSLGNWSI